MYCEIKSKRIIFPEEVKLEDKEYILISLRENALQIFEIEEADKLFDSLKKLQMVLDEKVDAAFLRSVFCRTEEITVRNNSFPIPRAITARSGFEICDKFELIHMKSHFLLLGENVSIDSLKWFYDTLKLE